MLDLPRDRLLSTTDVAHVLGCSRDTVLRAIRIAGLPSLNIAVDGRERIRVHPDDLEAWLDARRNRQPTQGEPA